MDIDGNWFGGSGVYIKDWDPDVRPRPASDLVSKIGVSNNPTVGSTDRALWTLGVVLPVYIFVAGLTVGVLHVVKKKRGGETIVPVWALGLGKRVRERRSGAREGREIRLENMNGNGRSEV